jgi:hypothetical protein
MGRQVKKAQAGERTAIANRMPKLTVSQMMDSLAR